jgi:hypothetical protein
VNRNLIVDHIILIMANAKKIELLVYYNITLDLTDSFIIVSLEEVRDSLVMALSAAARNCLVSGGPRPHF